MTPSPSDLPRLDRLRQWLTAESYAGVGALAVVFLPFQWVIVVLALAAVVFTPILVLNLWALRQTGWLVGFAVWVGGAALILTILSGSLVGGLRSGVVLFAFYSYTWALKLTVSEWCREATEAAVWASTQARWAADAETAETLSLRA